MGTLTRRAQLAAQLQYGPQVSALLGLMQQATQDYQTGLAASRAASSGIAASARKATPVVRSAYDQAVSDSGTQHNAVAAALAALSPVADGFKAAAATEQANSDRQIQGERARALTDMADRIVRAREGAAYDQQALGNQLALSRSRIGQELQNVTAEQGAAAQKTLLDLLDAQTKTALAQGNLSERTRHDRATENQAALNAAARNHGKMIGGVRVLTTAQQNRAFDQVEQARGWIQRLGAGNTSGRIRAMLRTGATLHVPMLDPTVRQVPGQPVYLRDASGQPKMQVVRVPQISKTLVNTAYDLEKLGYISVPNVRALHQTGLLVGKRYRIALGGRNQMPPGTAGPPSPRVGYAH